MDKKNSTQKKAPSSVFFLIQINEKKNKRKKNVRAAAAAARFFSARQPLVRRQHPVVDHRRGVTSAVRGRDERRDPNRACLRLRLLSSLLRLVLFFVFRVALLKRAPKRATTMAIKIEIAPIHSMTKKTTMMDSRIQSSPKEARDATSPDHPLSLSLSTGDDDDDVNDESPKSEEKDGTSRVDDFGFCTTFGETKRDRGASFRLRRR